MSGTTDAAIKLALNEEERAKRNRKAAKEAQGSHVNNIVHFPLNLPHISTRLD